MASKDREHLVQIIQLALGYCRSQVLMTACDLDVFTEISRGRCFATEIAEACNSSPSYTERLLNACVAIGLLKHSNGRYENLRIADHYLIAGREQYMGNWISLMMDWYRPWGALSESVRTGQPVEDPLAKLGKDSDYTHHFIEAMNDYAMGPGSEMIHHVDLAGRSSLLDVGGGPGSYSILLAEKYPELKADIFDLPSVLELAKKNIAAHNLSERVSVVAGDYHLDSLGHDYDVVLISNVLHQEDPDSCLRILTKAYDALSDEGMLIVQAMFLNNQKDGPVWPTLHSLLLFLVYQGGRAYSYEETLEQIRHAGFSESKIERMSLFNAESMIIARKG